MLDSIHNKWMLFASERQSIFPADTRVVARQEWNNRARKPMHVKRLKESRNHTVDAATL
jgi:hypothetical protein